MLNIWNAYVEQTMFSAYHMVYNTEFIRIEPRR